MGKRSIVFYYFYFPFFWYINIEDFHTDSFFSKIEWQFNHASNLRLLLFFSHKIFEISYK